MDFDQIAEAVGRQFMTAWNAPIPFLAAVAAAAFVIWKLVQREFATRLSNAESTAALYKEKLDGASPQAAKDLIENLERRIEALTPLTLTTEQRRSFISQITPHEGYSSACISADGGSLDARNLARVMARCFADAGWTVSTQMIDDHTGLPRPNEVVMIVTDPEDLIPDEVRVPNALRAAGLEFRYQTGRNRNSINNYLMSHTVDLRVTGRAEDQA